MDTFVGWSDNTFLNTITKSIRSGPSLPFLNYCRKDVRYIGTTLAKYEKDVLWSILIKD